MSARRCVDTRRRVWVAFVVLACLVFPLFRLHFLVRDYTVEILYYQQLDFYDAYFQKLSWPEIFRFQHGEHRLGLGGIMQSMVLDASSWRNSAVSYSIVLILLLAASGCASVWKWWTVLCPSCFSWYSLGALGAVVLSFFDFARDFQWGTSVNCFTFPHQPLYEYIFFIALMPAKFIGFSYLLMPGVALIVGFILQQTS